jgi:carbonic anhydrase
MIVAQKMFFLIIGGFYIIFCIYLNFLKHLSRQISPIQILKKGNDSFVKSSWFGSPCRAANRAKPHTAVLTCSDHRISVEKIFNASDGSLIVIREAGQATSDNSIASIEHAIIYFKVRQLVVMGHTECEVVRSAFEGQELDSSKMNEMTKNITENLSSDIVDLTEAIKRNNSMILVRLMKGSEIIKNAVESNQLKLYSCIYNIRTGRVEFNLEEGFHIKFIIQSFKNL